MKDLVKLGPLAVGLALFGMVVAYMLQRNMTPGPWLFAAFLLGHGLVHVMFAAPAPAPAPAGGMEYPFDIGRSWLVTGRFLDREVIRVLVLALVALTVAIYALTALATLNFVVPNGLWAPLLITATTGSVALMVIGLTPALSLGIVIDVVLFAIALSNVWSPAGQLPA